MSSEESYTEEQRIFLEECMLEFSDRYTDADPDYKKVWDNDLPPPPIMYPWYGGTRRNQQNRYNNYQRGYRDRKYENNQGRNYDRPYNPHFGRNRGDNRYRPY